MNILVVSNIHTSVKPQDVARICEVLTAQGALVTTATFAAGEQLSCHTADLIITIGGDGTIMHVAKQAAGAGIPVLGINSGKLGFLAGMEMDETHLLQHLFDGCYHTEERMLLDVTVDGCEGTYLAMNEAVVSRGALSRLVDLTVVSDDNDVMHYRADGILVATPTGSTAYSLSAGGPVVDPRVACVLLTPICPHSLYARSHVFNDDTVLHVQTANTRGETFLTVDGEAEVQIPVGGTVTVKKSQFTARLVRLKTQSFQDVLQEKLISRDGGLQ
ncbi:MAG: NAD(+)/NADH kinase [Clostridia bacterium]|nr:NAD(+)/NADH kinase [Clostridia bacterium]